MINNEYLRPVFRELTQFTLLVALCLASAASYAVSLSTELTAGAGSPFFTENIPGQVAISDSVIIGGVQAAAGSVDATLGTFRSDTRTTVEASSDPGEFFSNLAQANVQMSNLVFNWGDPLGNYDIGTGQIGMNFDAVYTRDQQNATSGVNQFQLRLTAQVFDSTGARTGSATAGVNHRLTFNATSVTEASHLDLSSGSGVLDIGGSYVEGTRTTGGIDGQLLLPAITLLPGDSLILSVLMFSQADTRAPRTTPEADWPFSRTNASNTAQLFADIELHPSLTINIDLPAGESLAWVGDGNGIPPVPVPAAVWLFASALLGIAGLARTRRGLPAST